MLITDRNSARYGLEDENTRTMIQKTKISKPFLAVKEKNINRNTDMAGGAGESGRDVLSRNQISRLRGEWRGKLQCLASSS